MKFRLFPFILFSTNALAFQCYFTPMKGDCWKDYDVTIHLIDYSKQKDIVPPITLEKKTMWKRVPFDCNPKDSLIYTASFKPAIWKSQKDTVYKAKRIWFLPDKINKGIIAWNVPLCFPTAFSQVPIPPKADSDCSCSVQKSIPDIPQS